MAEARHLMRENPPESYGPTFIPDEVDFVRWAKQSHDLAIQGGVYNIAEGEAPSDEYVQNAQAVTRRLVVLAGYRLAVVLNKLLSNESSAIGKENSNIFEKLMLQIISPIRQRLTLKVNFSH